MIYSVGVCKENKKSREKSLRHPPEPPIGRFAFPGGGEKSRSLAMLGMTMAARACAGYCGNFALIPGLQGIGMGDYRRHFLRAVGVGNLMCAWEFLEPRR